MRPYRFHIPTAVYFGEECVKKNAAVFKRFGGKAYIITSRFPPGIKHYSLEDVEEVLKSQEIEYKIYEDVFENPPDTLIIKLADEVAAYDPEFLIALGGGSAIDTAKGVSVLLNYPGEDPMEVLFGGVGQTGIYTQTTNDGGLPLIAVPTTAGTSAEVTAAAVLTCESRHTKVVMSHKCNPDVALLDAKYIMEMPPRLTHTGAIDALAHGVEAYVNIAGNFMSRSLAEIGFKLFAQFKDRMYTNTLTYEDREKMMIHANLQGMAVMHAGTTLPHGMGYSLSVYKNVPHGLACGIFLGEYIRAFKNQSLVMPVVNMCGFNTVDDFADYIGQILANDIDIKVTEEEIAAWVKEFYAINYRLERHPEPITLKEITQIYRRALRKYLETEVCL